MTIPPKPLRPSSQKRLERWAKALRTAEDERLRKSIDRRFDAEFRRGNLPGDVIDAIEHELGRGEEYRLAELACARIEGTDEYRERRQALEETQWRDMLNMAWSQPLISLTDAAYWIATSGEPREPHDDDLERAACELVAELQSGDLIAHGIGNTPFHEAIPINHIRTATRDGAPIFGEAAFDDAPFLSWAIIPGENRRDTIEDCVSVHWRDVSVMKVDLQRLWPARALLPAPALCIAPAERQALKPISVQRAMELLREEAAQRGGKPLSHNKAEKYLNSKRYYGRDNIRAAVNSLTGGRKPGRQG